MNPQQRVAHVVALVVIGACVLAVPVLAQDHPETVGSRDRPGWATDVAGDRVQAHVSGSWDLEGDDALPAAAGLTFNPQFVIWTDALANVMGTTAHNTLHDEFMVGWTTLQDEWSHDIWARRLRPDGTLLEHFNVAAVAGEYLNRPVITYCPMHDEYLVAFTNFYDGSGLADVQARRVAWDGGSMSDVFTVTPGVAQHVDPSVAYCTPCDEFVVTYTNQWPGGELDLYAQRVRAADGTLLDMNFVASGGGWNRTYSSTAFHPAMYGGAGGYLIAYLAASSPPSGTRVWYKITHTELYDLYVNPELEASSTTTAAFGVWPQVAAGETGFLVAWWEASGGGYQVKARRISAEGSALGPPEGFPVSGVCLPPTTTHNLAVTYAYPQLYLVLWEYPTPSGTAEIHGIFVSEVADMTLGDESVVSEAGSAIPRPTVVCSPMSDCLIAYNWWSVSSLDIAGEIVRLRAVFSDGFESGDTSAWSATLP